MTLEQSKQFVISEMRNRRKFDVTFSWEAVSCVYSLGEVVEWTGEKFKIVEIDHAHRTVVGRRTV